MVEEDPRWRLYRGVLQIMLGLGLLIGALGATGLVGPTMEFSAAIQDGRPRGHDGDWESTTYSIRFTGSRLWLESRERRHMAFPFTGYSSAAIEQTVALVMCYETVPAPYNRWSALGIPLWLPLVVLVAFPACVLFAPELRRRRRQQLGLCLHCGYDLRDNASGRCPECGASTSDSSDTAESETTSR